MDSRNLINWFNANARDLPWRKRVRDPYHSWVSEIMLQQTRVTTVVPYFQAWIRTFPTIHKLASAPIEHVLKAWEGLGYYRRAKNLHRAAQQVVSDHNGELPRESRLLTRLPGIGSYTAAAIGSMVFNEKVLAVDGNIKRVASRQFKIGLPTETNVRNHLSPHLPGETGLFNEALMELGATICTPSDPSCSICPVQPSCAASRDDEVANYPAPKVSKPVPTRKMSAVISLDGGKVGLRLRDEIEMLGGLWGFPLTASPNIPPGKTEALPEVKHSYTHFHLVITPLIYKSNSMVQGFSDQPSSKMEYVTLQEAAKLPLSRLDHKIINLLIEKGILTRTT